MNSFPKQHDKIL